LGGGTQAASKDERRGDKWVDKPEAEGRKRRKYAKSSPGGGVSPYGGLLRILGGGLAILRLGHKLDGGI